jgi:hypothetical protein
MIVVLATGLVGSVSGCDTGCKKTTLQVRPIQVSDPEAPLTISARLTRDGQPFAGAKVKLGVLELGPNSSHAEALYYATTDADGVARATRREGAVTVPGARVTGYAAYFQPFSGPDEVRYCWQSVGAAITCKTGGGYGPCP